MTGSDIFDSTSPIIQMAEHSSNILIFPEFLNNPKKIDISKIIVPAIPYTRRNHA